MKNILHISLIVAAAIFASCTMTVVEYEAAGDIGLAPAAGNMTKVAVGTSENDVNYPTNLNMIIFAESVGNQSTEPDYIDHGEFAYLYSVGSRGGWDSENDEAVYGANDLTYFPSTATAKQEGYHKTDNNGIVPVTMLHTCSWISFIVKGDDVSTGIVGSKYTIDEIKITDIYKKGNVTCQGTTVDMGFQG